MGKNIGGVYEKIFSDIIRIFYVRSYNSFVYSDWRELVAGKTMYSAGVEIGKFSADAKTITMNDGKSAEITKSTVDSAEYEGTGHITDDGTIFDSFYGFSNVTTSGGKVRVTYVCDGMLMGGYVVKFTFSTSAE